MKRILTVGLTPFLMIVSLSIGTAWGWETEDLRPEGNGVQFSLLQAEPGVWTSPEGGFRLGLTEFSVGAVRQEWSVGLGPLVGWGVSPRSYLGGGLSLNRPESGEDELAGGTSVLGDTGVEAWVGGCVVCPLGPAAQLSVEMRWSPSHLSLRESDSTRDEGRAGLSLQVLW